MSQIIVDTIKDSNGNERYACRAWVNFNGTGTVAIRASGNVSSITDNGTGDYTVNFTNAMPDSSYAFNGTTQLYSTSVGTAANVVSASLNTNPTVFAFRLEVKYAGGGVVDLPYISVAIFR